MEATLAPQTVGHLCSRFRTRLMAEAQMIVAGGEREGEGEEEEHEEEEEEEEEEEQKECA